MKTLTPLKSIRKYCLWCMNDQPVEVRLCPTDDCLFYKLRSGKGRPKLRTIRKKCIDCSGGEFKRVAECEFNGKDNEMCSLYPYRKGKRPPIQGLPLKRRVKGKIPLALRQFIAKNAIAKHS
jgi:hypothetical protein